MHQLSKESSFQKLFFFALGLLIIIGCRQGEGASVSGKARLSDGTPLVKARVIAQSVETEKWASGVTDQQGHFTLGTEQPGEPLPAGEYMVTVVEDRGDWDHPQPRKISPKYADGVTSGLELLIDSSEDQTLDLTLDPP